MVHQENYMNRRNIYTFKDSRQNWKQKTLLLLPLFDILKWSDPGQTGTEWAMNQIQNSRPGNMVGTSPGEHSS